MLINHGFFDEFIVADTFYENQQTVHSLEEVSLGLNYVMIISTTAGLWRYNIGDTVQFSSLKPYKVIVSGRIKHFISAFGEHVIVSEIEDSLKEAIDQDSSIVRVREFSVAPQIEPELGLPYHEWFIEFETPPKNLEVFAKKIDDVMRAKNIYYNDLITGKILRPLILRKVVTEGFKKYMKSIGKLGGQNKVPRASDNRKIADALSPFLLSPRTTK